MSQSVRARPPITATKPPTFSRVYSLVVPALKESNIGPIKKMKDGSIAPVKPAVIQPTRRAHFSPGEARLISFERVTDAAAYLPVLAAAA